MGLIRVFGFRLSYKYSYIAARHLGKQTAALTHARMHCWTLPYSKAPQGAFEKSTLGQLQKLI